MYSYVTQVEKDNTFFFYNSGTSTANTGGMIAWSVPDRANFISFKVIGGGGGGAGGGQGAAGTARSGGGGGGSGAVSSLFIPAKFIPSTIYICVGNGGHPGVTNTASTGGAGGISAVLLDYDTSFTPYNTLIIANGGNGGFLAGSAGGAGGAISNTNNCPLASAGIYEFAAGVQGVNGGSATVNPADLLPFTNFFLTGGGGGGGTSTTNVGRKGSDILANGLMPAITGSAGGVNPVPGSNGIFRLKPLMSMGGAGGGGGSQWGGKGGDGAFGCGGGGGGAGITTTGAGGTGGTGGSGLVIIGIA